MVKKRSKKDGDKKLYAFITTFFSIIGFVIAILAWRDDKYVMFYAKQSLVVFIVAVIAGIVQGVLMWIPIIGWLIYVALSVIVFVLWQTLQGLDLNQIAKETHSSAGKIEKLLEIGIEEIEALIEQRTTKIDVLLTQGARALEAWLNEDEDDKGIEKKADAIKKIRRSKLQAVERTPDKVYGEKIQEGLGAVLRGEFNHNLELMALLLGMSPEELENLLMEKMLRRLTLLIKH